MCTRRVEGQTPREIATNLRESAIFRVLLAPFDVFTRTIFAERWFPDFLGWGAAALAIDAALLVLVLKLDANYIESAATISQKVYERIRRTKQGGGIAMPAGPGGPTTPAPAAPLAGRRRADRLAATAAGDAHLPPDADHHDDPRRHVRRPASRSPPRRPRREPAPRPSCRGSRSP